MAKEIDAHVMVNLESEGRSVAVQGMARLLDIMRQLRDPRFGCPWDVEQSHESIAPNTIEEAYEVVDAIERQDIQALRSELGDLLLQVVFHATIAEDNGHFEFSSVVKAISDKLIRRHPHVFGDDAPIETAEDQIVNWESLKAEERKDASDSSEMAGIAIGLPALTRSLKIQQRAARVGYDFPAIDDVFLKIEEELTELGSAVQSGSSGEISSEFGDLLFSCVNLARHLDVDPSTALRDSNSKFIKRFRDIEALLEQTGNRIEDLNEKDKDAIWQEIKLQD